MFNIRLDRSATLLWRPVVRGLNLVQGARLPILMYHSVSHEMRAGHPYFETNTTPQVFEEQMAWLHSNGYTAMALESAVERLKTGQLHPKHVVITFDDGLRDFYTAAFPILERHGFTATMFVVTDWVARGVSPSGKEILTWDLTRELRDRGISIGSHSATHSILREMNKLQLERELADSKAAIEEQLGAAVTSFAYPYAFPQEDPGFVECFRNILARQGYTSCVTTRIGRVRPRDDKFYLPRLPVNRWDDNTLLRAKLEGAYDWLQVPQSLFKKLQQRTLRFARLSTRACLPD
jgi:peptidoglycan/xylan/chitin deacetylase (PgdA/CDA1 family)